MQWRRTASSSPQGRQPPVEGRPPASVGLVGLRLGRAPFRKQVLAGTRRISCGEGGAHRLFARAVVQRVSEPDSYSTRPPSVHTSTSQCAPAGAKPASSAYHSPLAAAILPTYALLTTHYSLLTERSPASPSRSSVLVLKVDGKMFSSAAHAHGAPVSAKHDQPGRVLVPGWARGVKPRTSPSAA